MSALKAVILVGHGGIPTDCPPELVRELKRLEAEARGRTTTELRLADQRLRRWPRTAKTDPYQPGLEAVAAALAKRLPGRLVLTAYNEFCSPSLEEAFETAAARGAREIAVITTMYTRGGIHSEKEIPEELKALAAKHPGVEVAYCWPFDLENISRLLADEIERHCNGPYRALAA